jgi:hypothetical protein
MGCPKVNRKWFGTIALGVATVVVALIACAVTSSANSSETAAVIGLVALAAGIVIVSTLGKRIPALSFYSLYAFSHAALFVLRPAYNGIFQGAIDPFGAGPHEESIVSAALVAGLGFLCVSLAYGLLRDSRSSTATSSVRPIPEREWRNLLPLIVLVVIAGVALYSVYVRQVGGIASLIAVSSGRSVELTRSLASSSGYFTSGLLFTLGASTVIYCQGLITRRRGLALLGVALLIIGSGPQLLSGSRSVFLPLAITLLAGYVWIYPGRVRFWHVLAAAVPAFLALFILPRVLRQAPDGAAGATLGDQLAPHQVLDGFFGGLDTAMIDAFAHQLAGQASGQLSATNGSTYLAALGAVVPRAWWPQKPETVDNLLNNVLFPETAAKSIGFSFGMYSEPYLNFGLVGVVVFCMLVGIVLGLLDNRISRPVTLVQLAILALAVGTIFPIVRGSLTFDLQRLIIPAAPIIIIAVLVKTFQKRNATEVIDNSVASDVAQYSRSPTSVEPFVRF